MRILLLGEFSNVHATLAKGLRAEGHNVTLASDGDGWKDYPRDIDLRRPEGNRLSQMRWLWHLWKNFRTFQGYDVVQLINPIFLPLRAERLYRFYRFLRKHNKKIYLGAFGMDKYYVRACVESHLFRYSDFNIGTEQRRYFENDIWVRDWLKGAKGALNDYIAQDADGIVAGLYEYYAAYKADFGHRLRFIPFPIVPSPLVHTPYTPDRPIRFFIGIQQKRNAYKGTDIMWHALLRLREQYPERVELIQAISLPFDEYIHQMQQADVLLDQLYAYTPAMNALEAMGRGICVVGGGEPENYTILNCSDIRPIINVYPTEESVYKALCLLVENHTEIPRLQKESRLYIERYHDYRKVARCYLDFWLSSSEPTPNINTHS